LFFTKFSIVDLFDVFFEMGVIAGDVPVDVATAVNNYSAVFAISEMAKLVIETVNGKFHFVTYMVGGGLAFIVALIAYFGFNQYRIIRDTATAEAKKIADPIKLEYEKVLSDLQRAKEEHSTIATNLAKLESGIQGRANNLIDLQIANICMSSAEPTEKNMREAGHFLEKIIENTEPTEESSYILSVAYTMYSYILRRKDGDGKQVAFELLEKAVSDGITGGGIYYNMACYSPDRSSSEIRKYLDQAIKQDPGTFYNAMEDDDLRECVKKIYKQAD